MRQTTNSERRLGILFGLAIFILLNLMLLVFLKKQKVTLQTTLATLQNQETQAKLLLNDETYWDSRGDWLESNRPTFALSGDAQTELIETLQNTPREHGLEATPPVPDEPKSLGLFEEVSATIKITGDISAVVAWLAQIQQPGKFQTVSNISLQSDKEPPKVICEVRVAKWFFIGAPEAQLEDPQVSNSARLTTTPGAILFLPAADRR